jgi:hypothetical protein
MGHPITVATDYRAHLRACLKECAVPLTLHEGLTEYLAARRPTGGFLQAVLENDLSGAAMRADPDNRLCLWEIVLFLHTYVPAPAWGSPEKVAAWLADPEPAPELFES